MISPQEGAEAVKQVNAKGDGKSITTVKVLGWGGCLLGDNNH